MFPTSLVTRVLALEKGKPTPRVEGIVPVFESFASMTMASNHDSPALGFLTVWDKPHLGHIGGYLLLNAQARPLEFHCTAPVVPNRAQEILYGRTLHPYLYGEQIGIALTERTKQPPRLIVTDRPEILQARAKYETPMLFVHVNAAGDHASVDLHNAFGPDMYRFAVPQNRVESRPEDSPGVAIRRTEKDKVAVAVAANFRADQRVVEEFCKNHGEGLDWLEPFERIREAISEAHRPAA